MLAAARTFHLTQIGSMFAEFEFYPTAQRFILFLLSRFKLLRALNSMIELKESISNFSDIVFLFSKSLSSDVDQLKENLLRRPCTGASSYRHCLEELNERAILLACDIKALEESSLDVLSFDEMLKLSTELFEENKRSISSLELHLALCGHRSKEDTYMPVNPLDKIRDSLESLQLPTAPLAQKSSTGTRQPIKAKEDTPSSLASPQYLSPTLKALLGKYATSGEESILSMPNGLCHDLTPPSLMKSHLSPAFQTADTAFDRGGHHDYSSVENRDPEESTIELKAQLISSRGLNGHGSEAPVHSITRPTLQTSLQEAIAAALSQKVIEPMHSIPSNPGSLMLPPLRLIGEGEYSSLPSFIKAQMPIETLNATLTYVFGLLEARAVRDHGHPTFSLEDLESVLGQPQAKVFVNSMNKLGRVQLRVVLGQGTKYHLL